MVGYRKTEYVTFSTDRKDKHFQFLQLKDYFICQKDL